MTQRVPVTMTERRRPARHAGGPTLPERRIAARLILSGRPHYLPLLLSDQARMILARKYDAFTTDRAYQNLPHGKLWLLGKAADAIVLRFPVHRALRRRLQLVSDALARAAAWAAGEGADPVRILSAPCGLARDVLLAAGRLPPEVTVAWTGLDLDERGDVLPEAARRAREAGVEIDLLREDLFAPETGLSRKVAAEGPFHVVNCIGLTSWVDDVEVRTLLARFRELTAPGATLIVDAWRPDGQARLARRLELPAHYHEPEAFERTLERSGFAVVASHSTGDSCTVWVARKVWR